MMKNSVLVLISALFLLSCNWEEVNYGLGVQPEAGSIPLMGGTFFMVVHSNAQWRVDADDWIMVSPNSGVGDATLTVTVSGTEMPREGSIRFTLPDGKTKETIIKQCVPDGKIAVYYDLVPSVSDNGLIYKAVVLSDAPWEAECDSWIKVEPKGSGRYKTNVIVTALGEVGGDTMTMIKVVFKLDNGASDYIRDWRYFKPL